MLVRRLLGAVAAATAALLVGALPAQAATSYPPNPPTIRIDKTRVVVGDHATVTATGCGPGASATVTVSVPGPPGQRIVDSQTVTADAGGTVVATVPSSPGGFTRLGSNLVTVTCVDPNGKTLSQSVRVTVVPKAAIWADHNVVHEGDRVKITATGYAFGSKATVRVRDSHGSTVFSGYVFANPSGTVTVTLPFDQAGTFTVQVLGVALGGGPLSQSITINVLGTVMPHTGADILPFSAGGVALLLAGVGLVLVTRRRRAARG